MFSREVTPKVRGEAITPIGGVRGMDERQVRAAAIGVIDLEWRYLR
jgi:hypothetical protein